MVAKSCFETLESGSWIFRRGQITNMNVYGPSFDSFQISQPFYKLKGTNKRGMQRLWDSQYLESPGVFLLPHLRRSVIDDYAKDGGPGVTTLCSFYRGPLRSLLVKEVQLFCHLISDWFQIED